jgi:hypothetical protein
MKYLIKESQIKKFIWDYFNSEDYDISEDDNDIFLLDDYGNFDWNYTFEDGRLLVSNDIIVVIEGMFSISYDDALEYAGQWFEEKYGHFVEEIVNWDL